MNPHQVTRDFEAALCEYTGARYAVAVNSCTSALMLAVAWHVRRRMLDTQRYHELPQAYAEREIAISIPRRTYLSVPMSIIHAGATVQFHDEEWLGCYELKEWWPDSLHPTGVWDSARWFTRGMYKGLAAVRESREGLIGLKFEQRDMAGAMVCVSFHASKTLGLEQGGAILHDSIDADVWLRRARFDGRAEGVAPKDDKIYMIGYHAYMNPSTAAQGLLRLHSLRDDNAPLPNDDYPDLSTIEVFR